MSAEIECAFSGIALKPPELRTSKAGKPYAQFSLAVGEGENRKFVRICAFGETAEKVAAQLKVGGRAYVEGSLDVGVWAPEGRPPQANLNLAARRVEILNQIGKNRPKREQPATRNDRPVYLGHERPFDDDLPM